MRPLGKRKRNGKGTGLGVDPNPDNRSCSLILLPKHKIFLSHSGEQKWFVEKLCEDLESRHRFPFFDKRPSSLPKGERFPKLILEAAEQCELAVVVVSEEYLTSKWPMIELNTFVRVLSGANRGLKILPLFLEMSVSDFKSSSRQGAWLKVWNEWAMDDGRIKPVEFEEALKVMRSYNGIEFDGDMSEVWSYEKDVVRSICGAIAADVKWDDSHVQGRSTICEATQEKIKMVEPSEKYGIRVFGYYGVGGIGKTTMCKTLCNELWEFSGKVCHIELGGIQSEEQMLKEVLKKLTSTSEELLQSLNEGECPNVLKTHSSWRQKTFLAIDNVWDDSKSMEQAKMFLKDPAFREGSVVMVTSRIQSTLMQIGIHKSHCFEVPELGEVDARNLFLHHVANGEEFVNEEDNLIIEQCLARCRFRKSKKQDYHYLPLALKVLGVHLGYFGDNPLAWLEGLPKVRDFNLFPEENSVFNIIRLNYDRLSVQLQAFFMDVALFKFKFNKLLDLMDGNLRFPFFDWLSLVHRLKLQDTQCQLQQLKERGLVEDVDTYSQRVSMHDLYKEFAKLEAQGKLNSSTSFSSRRWVYSEGLYPLDLEMTPFGRCWENLIRVRIKLQFEDSEEVFNLRGIQWRYCSNLMVLRLEVGVKANGLLNLEGLRCLRSLELDGLDGSGGVEGVEDLNNLKYFRWNGDDEAEFNGSSFLGQLPASLEVLDLGCADVCLRSDVFDRCTNLRTVCLYWIRGGDSMDFRRCTSLRNVFLHCIRGLQKLLVFATGLQSCLQSLQIRNCQDLSCVSGLGDLVRLDRLDLWDNPMLEELPDLQKLTSLQYLSIGDSFYYDEGKRNIAEVRGLGSLGQLLELHCLQLDATELPNLSALEHLHVLDLEGCTKLTALEGVAGLTALQHVNLSGCWSLLRLPDLSNSTKLKRLDLSESRIELYEEDIGMLAALPRLRWVKLGTVSSEWDIELDPVKRKVVKLKYVGGREVEAERNLETLPIKIFSYEF